MATAAMAGSENTPNNDMHASVNDLSDPFVDEFQPRVSSHAHRYSSLVDPDSITLGTSASPSQVKRSIIAHLAETERRLQDAQKLGQSLLLQQSQLTEKLHEVEAQQGDAEISPELRQRLADLEKEHNDVGKEIARALLGPKSRAVSGEEKPPSEQSTFSSQATASPTKVTAPSRRQRNQPSNRAGDLQFAADISTSLLAQVRQLQSAVAERDELLKQVSAERDQLEQDKSVFAQRLRVLDESEQKYKDENWNLETQTHELLAAAREAADREKRLTASLSAAVAEKSRLQSEMDEIRLAHDKLANEHASTRKAHDSELHTLKRTIELGDSERAALQGKIDELTAQNHELARAVAARLRGPNPDAEISANQEPEEEFRNYDDLENSPPASPTKATPRHGGLESETLRSSLHHAHRMIQNLKNNIHREKTEKIELKRMLQEARDELEQRRGDGSLGSGTKRQKTKSDIIKKPPRLDMLGGSRRMQMDIELEDDDWEDHFADTPTHNKHLTIPTAAEGRSADVSDAYQTANETEGAFETADERHATESEDFQTGAESLAGDSTDDLTETEETASHGRRLGPIRALRPSLAFKPAGDRQSFISTASTSAGEDEDELKTPIVAQSHKFRIRNGRDSFARQSRVPTDSTPINLMSDAISQDSPATVTSERSTPAAEQSLFAELGGMDDASSFGTPGRTSIASVSSTPGFPGYTPSQRTVSQATPLSAPKTSMVDSGTMTEPWKPESDRPARVLIDAGTVMEPPSPDHDDLRTPLPSDFPLPPTVPVSPIKQIDNGTQYTPQRLQLQDSPMRNTAFITPPKTVWDEAQSPGVLPSETESTPHPQTPGQLNYSGLLMHDTAPKSPENVITLPPHVSLRDPESLTFSIIQTQSTEPIEAEPANKSTGVAASTQVEDLPSRPTTAEKVSTTGLLASAAAALGFAKSKEGSNPVIAEDETSEPVDAVNGSQREKHQPLRDTSGNRMPTKPAFPAKSSSPNQEDRLPLASSNDQSSQTLLTSEQIEEALRAKSAVPVAFPEVKGTPDITAPPLTPLAPAEASQGSKLSETQAEPLQPMTSNPSPIKRPSNASNQWTAASMAPHPPLPPDHKAAIAKAGGRVASPTRGESASNQGPTIMGPPALPASAMRRPKTPADSIRSPTRESDAPRTSNVSRGHRGTITSQLSHRSSVSSFASEIDERFNMHPNAHAGPHGFGTDPRIIQAITQTMIGEFLWKYTRKAGRAEMSETRHLRYFWVHPYTKTLYWSDKDPQTAGRNELKAKSVLIQSVHVVPDDNPMPPGLHRKSLEVITPGRRVRFTATTGQRHETWFNALNYLLLRGDDVNSGTYTTDGDHIRGEDVDEFNVNAGGYGATLAPTGSRMSLSSYNSRTTRGTSSNRASAAQRQPAATTAGIANTSATRVVPQDSTASRTAPNSTIRRSRAEHSRQGSDQERTVRASSVSRFSRMIGSVTGRGRRMSETANTHSHSMTGGRSEGGSIYDASVVSDGRVDSAEELRREMLRQEEIGFGGLENVRACCDGKHDVSTLSHSHRNATGHGHTHRALSMSMSLRGTARRGGGGGGFTSAATTPARANAAAGSVGPGATPTRTGGATAATAT
ncbi:Anucleate primary sterigmata protein A [Exophiala dermatitidis]